jgi:transposase
MRCRIDFTYALALVLDDPGLPHSVLADFRDRLTEDDRADRLLDLALACLKAAGLVSERGRQRTDPRPRPGGRRRPDPPRAGHRGHARRP